ncbi:exosome complex component MTR3 [Frankliniella occidentalis]|uniref:Exosome complex component MTR3 n=1 Tax=Frankliniella occidentalis TaxID=133901 RepID=A0A6J1S4Q2_FRAOC|nr:exosome complex component MTR3 [Frankliniella occidentalis]
MPTDNRRIQGPEISTPYCVFGSSTENEDEDGCFKSTDPLSSTRKDGRALLEHRKIYMKTGVVSQAKGSAYIELNNTKVICSVFDPREIPNRVEYSQHGELFCVLKFAPFSCTTRRSHQQDAEEKELSLNLKRALEPAVCRHEFPNFQVDIYVLILESDGGSLAASITCAGLALADAHVPMYDLVTAASLGVAGDVLMKDPSEEEEKLCSQHFERSNLNHGLITVSLMGAHTQITQVWQTGSMTTTCVSESLTHLIQSCEETYPIAQRCLVKSVVDTISKKKVPEQS